MRSDTSRPGRPLRTGACVAALFCSGACTGEIDELRTVPGAADPSTPTTTPPPQEAQFEPLPAGLRVLTPGEYRRTIADLFGAQAGVSAELQPIPPKEGFTTVGAAELDSQAMGPVIEKLETAGWDVAHAAFAADRRAAFVGCAPTAADDPCVESFLASFGQRAWRRRLDAAELERYRAVVSQVSATFDNDVWAGLEQATAALVSSPHFLFRPEVGVADPALLPDRRRLTSDEMAARLSYFLVGTTPDRELLTAAAARALDTPAGIRAEAARLAGRAQSKTALMSMLREYLDIEHVDKIQKDAKAFPQMTPALAASMRLEMERFVDDVAFKRLDMRELFLSRTTFLDGRLAGFYGVAGPTGDAATRVTLPESLHRAGLLTTAGFLASAGTFLRGSAVVRGARISDRFLCRTPPPPPANVNQAAVDSSSGQAVTMRQRLERHRANPSCAACHAAIDPLGLPFEHFDGIGRYRETDNGLAIDATGEVSGTPVDGAIEVGKALAAAPQTAACLASQIFRHATGQPGNLVTGLGSALEDVTERFVQSGYDIQALALEIASSEAFRVVRAERVAP